MGTVSVSSTGSLNHLTINLPEVKQQIARPLSSSPQVLAVQSATSILSSKIQKIEENKKPIRLSDKDLEEKLVELALELPELFEMMCADNNKSLLLSTNIEVFVRKIFKAVDSHKSKTPKNPETLSKNSNATLTTEPHVPLDKPRIPLRITNRDSREDVIHERPVSIRSETDVINAIEKAPSRWFIPLRMKKKYCLTALNPKIARVPHE